MTVIATYEGATVGQSRVAWSTDASDAWGQSLFGSVSSGATAAFAESALEISLRAGELVPFRPNENDPLGPHGGQVGIVIDGLIRVFVMSGCRQVTVQYAGAADTFGVPTLGPGQSGAGLSASGQALVDSRLLLLCPQTFAKEFDEDITVAHAVANGVREALITHVSLLSENVLWPLRQRVARHLLDLAFRDGDRVTVPATVQEIADATGTVREVVTRLLKQMRIQGLIGRDNGKLILRDLRAMHLAAKGESVGGLVDEDIAGTRADRVEMLPPGTSVAA